MVHFLSVVVLALTSCAAVSAASSPRVESSAPAAADTSLQFTDASPVLSGPEAEAPSVVVLPGTTVKPPSQAEPRVGRPEPESSRSVAPAGKSEVAEDQPPVLRRSPLRLPEDAGTGNDLHLQRSIGLWKAADAEKAFGEPVRSRKSFNSSKEADGTIYAYTDPSRKYREIELDFDRYGGRLRGVFLYPWNMKWEDCRKLWGGKVSATKTPNGRRFYSYEDRRLDVLVDGSENVISLGLY